MNLVGKLGGRGLHIASQIILARLFGPVGFGLYSIGWNILRTVGIVAPLGLENGVIRFGAIEAPNEEESTRRVVRTSINLSLISGGALGLLFFLLSSWLADLIGKPDLAPVLRWFSLAFPLASGLKVAASATRITKRMRFGIIAEEIVQPVANLFFIFLFWVLGWGLLGAVQAASLSLLFGFLAAAWFTYQIFKNRVLFGSAEIRGGLRKLLAYSIPTAVAGMFASLMLLVDRLLVGVFLAEADAGIYQAVSLSSVLFVTVLAAFKTIVSPLAAEMHKKGEIAELKNLFQVSTRWGLYVSLPILLIIWTAPREIMSVVFGAEYEAGYLTLIVLSIAQLINVGTGVVDMALIMTGHEKEWLNISAIMFLANLALNILLIPRYGILGAALATAITYGGISILGLVEVRKVIGVWPYNLKYLKGVLATAITFSVLMLITFVNPSMSLLMLSIKSVAAIVIFGIVLVTLRLDSDDLAVLALVRKSSGGRPPVQ